MRKIIFVLGFLLLSLWIQAQCISSFSFSQVNCPTVDFLDASTSSSGVIVAWSWDFGDGSLSNLQNPQHTYTANGTYLACLTITTSAFCTNTFCDTINISCIAPVSCTSFFQYTLGLCPTVAFFDGSTASPGVITQWSWDFGDGSTATTQNPQHTYAANGSYVTCLSIVTSDSCTSTFCDTINISCITPASCTSFFQYTLGLCPTVGFFDGSTASPGNIIQWSWDFGDGNTAVTQNPQHTYTSNGTYLVCLSIVTSDSCTSTFCDTLTVSCILPPGCNAGFRFDATSNCPTVDFADTSTAMPGPIFAWSWDFGDGNTSTLQNPSHTYAADGSYTVCLITIDSFCVDTTCNLVVVNCASQPPTSSIPTVSEWGLLIISLLLVIIGTVAIRSARPRLESEGG